MDHFMILAAHRAEEALSNLNSHDLESAATYIDCAELTEDEHGRAFDWLEAIGDRIDGA